MCIHGINDDSRILVLFNEHKSGKIEGLPGPMTKIPRTYFCTVKTLPTVYI